MKLTTTLLLFAIAITTTAAESTNSVTVNPNSLSTESPSTIEGLGPQTPAGDNPKLKKAMESLAGSSNSNYYTIDLKSLPPTNTIDPKYLVGIGPKTPVGDNPKLKKAMDDFAKTTSPPVDPAEIELGPVVRPGMPGYDQNARFKQAWKDFAAKEGISSGSSDSTCTQVCPDVYDPVCGTDGVTYNNSCELGVASCKNPMKNIAKKSDGRCSS